MNTKNRTNSYPTNCVRIDCEQDETTEPWYYTACYGEQIHDEWDEAHIFCVMLTGPVATVIG